MVRVTYAAAVAATAILLSCAPVASTLDTSLDWPDLYDPEEVIQLNVKIHQSDLTTIKNDGSYEIEVPCLLWTETEGESEAVLVSIRQKSNSPVGSKRSYKIDINEYEDDPSGKGVNKWHGVKKLSLENGDDKNPVSENLAWYLHRLAAESTHTVYPDYHMPGMANFATLTFHVVNDDIFSSTASVSVQPQGVYVNVEQPDKTFLKNRGIYIGDQTWHYKQGDIGSVETKKAGCDEQYGLESPTVKALKSCDPFTILSYSTGRMLRGKPDKGGRGGGGDGGGDGGGGGGESSALCVAAYKELIDMEVFLAQAAVEAFSSSPDGMFTSGKNFYYTDFSDTTCQNPLAGTKRLHFTWDLDSAIHKVDFGIYASGKGKNSGESGYQGVFLGNAEFRAQFNTYLDTLVDDAFVNDAVAYLQTMKPIMAPHLSADTSGQAGEGTFDTYSDWLRDRAANVKKQMD